MLSLVFICLTLLSLAFTGFQMFRFLPLIEKAWAVRAFPNVHARHVADAARRELLICISIAITVFLASCAFSLSAA